MRACRAASRAGERVGAAEADRLLPADLAVEADLPDRAVEADRALPAERAEPEVPADVRLAVFDFVAVPALFAVFVCFGKTGLPPVMELGGRGSEK